MLVIFLLLLPDQTLPEQLPVSKPSMPRMLAGVSGSTMVLSCPLNSSKCGSYHSIKWYKAGTRVAVYSPGNNWWRAEGDMKDRGVVNVNDETANLTFTLAGDEDEGDYKCEITYLDISVSCPVVLLTRVVVMAMPDYVNITLPGGKQVTGGLIGPYHEGTDVTLVCEVGGGKPAPHIFWFVGDRLLGGRESFVEEFNFTVAVRSELVLKVSRDILGSKIVCKVTNEAMEDYMTAEVQVDVNLRPISTVISVEQEDIEEGSSVRLVCRSAGARPAACVTWYNGSLSTPLIQPSASSIASLQEDGTYVTLSTLVLTANRGTDNQWLYCKGTNEVSDISTDNHEHAGYQVRVKYLPAVQMQEGWIIVNQSDQFSISCIFHANPPDLLRVEWFHEEVLINTSNNKYSMEVSNNTLLTVRQVTAEDAGSYMCRLTNQVGTGEPDTPAVVVVHTRPRVTLRMEPVAGIVEGEKKNVSLSCEIEEGVPSVLTTVQWFMDSILLQQLPHCNEEDISHNDLCDVDPSKLMLENVNRHFHGNFSCIGINVAGQSEMSIPVYLEVFYPPGKATIIQSSDKVYKDGSVTFTCLVDDPGHPAVSHFIWTRGDQTMPGLTTPVWTIHSVSLHTQDNISCQAVNRAGEGIKGSKQIFVLSQPSFIQPLPPSAGYGVTSRQIQLSCQVECSPICHIGWYRDGSFIKNTSQLYTIISHRIERNLSANQAESTLSTLIFNLDNWPKGNLDPYKDSTEYTCQSTPNCHGSQTENCEGVKSSTSFNVEFPPENISISNNVISVVENEIPKAVLCNADGYPDPTYTWQFQGQDIHSGPVLHFPGGMFRDGAGLYICQASNRQGLIQAQARVEVLYKPECDIHQTITGNTLLIKCVADGNPGNYSFSWKKGNLTVGREVTSVNNHSILQRVLKSDNQGTYFCQVRNSVGYGKPCKTVVYFPGVAEQLSSSDAVVTIIVSCGVVTSLAVALSIVYCRRMANNNK